MIPKPYEIPAEMRELAERSVEQARKAFEGFVGAAQKAADQWSGASSAVPAGVLEFNKKTIGFAEANMRAAFDHAQSLVKAKDVQEVMQLQSEYVKTQIATFQEQAKEIGTMMQQAVKPKA